MTTQELKTAFHSTFGREGQYPVQCFFAPGRVCLIGEHIDYNGGLVMPAAISRGIYAAYRHTDNNVLWMCSTLDKRDITFPLAQEIAYDGNAGWGNYPLGVIQLLRQQGIAIGGCELLLHSDLPVGAGALSSSAAVEVLTAYIFSQQDKHRALDRTAIALLAKKAENDFIGLQCGIMDQFAVAMGKRDHAIVLNCDTLAYEYVPLQLGDYTAVVMNTNKSRQLSESRYNERTNECGEALAILQQTLPIQNLAEAKPEDVQRLIHDPILLKRAMHVATESERVIAAARALKANDLCTFGKLMTESHRSLKSDYEVSGLELDTLVETATTHPACLGGKMTGAGFGGCAVALVKRDALEAFTEAVLTRYHQVTGRDASVFPVAISDGVGEL